MTPNRTGTTGAAVETPYAAIELTFPLPPGEQAALFAAFERDIAGPLGLVPYSRPWWEAYHVYRRAWLGCLQHGWAIGRKETKEGMRR
jgi:hypothetical protein